MVDLTKWSEVQTRKMRAACEFFGVPFNPADYPQGELGVGGPVGGRLRAHFRGLPSVIVYSNGVSVVSPPGRRPSPSQRFRPELRRFASFVRAA